ncbi:ketopantoate reductase family protein [Methylomonas sp. MS20]|uniref:ketopantoate reductase family protein n=1 Tax=unclassified Methylomonas TaxID=2608980 RepID=UPI0028A30D22|nr:2-dehydropantoate 2-reductase [Methylomonas sp. MV1]MDT4330439.1 2-dehydropantoate 2-reductase [Methylomonas sp. MV1]
MSNKVLVVGSGAIGGFYGALLAKAGADVTMTCRSDFETVKRRGFRIDSRELGSWRFFPRRLVQRAGEYGGEPDFLLLCTKVKPDLDRAELIRDAVGPNTAIVFIQNGIDIEAELQAAFPDNELISGLAFVCCNRIAPGEIQHLAYGRLLLGNMPSGVSDKTRRLADLYRTSGIEAETCEDIVGGRWQKCVWNAPFNPLSVLSGGLATQTILQSQESLIRRIMTEVQAIAEAAGHPLPADIIERNIAMTRSMPPYKTSMLLDFETGQGMETEAILGNTVRAAERLGLDVPCLQSLYALMRLREQQSATGLGGKHPSHN